MSDYAVSKLITARLKEYVDAAVEELRDKLMVMIGEQEAKE